ncbi:MAG: hypothetical protein ABIH87_02225 [bacterium]
MSLSKYKVYLLFVFSSFLFGFFLAQPGSAFAGSVCTCQLEFNIENHGSYANAESICAGTFSSPKTCSVVYNSTKNTKTECETSNDAEVIDYYKKLGITVKINGFSCTFNSTTKKPPAPPKSTATTPATTPPPSPPKKNLPGEDTKLAEGCTQGEDKSIRCKITDPLGGTITDVNTLVGKVVAVALGLVGALSLFAFVQGGMTWFRSFGNPEKIKQGMHTMLFAVMGLLVTFLSYAVLKWIMKLIATGKAW